MLKLDLHPVRMAGALNLGLWTTAFFAYAAPGALFFGLPAQMVLYLLLCACLGVAMCTCLFFGMRSLRGSALKRGILVLAMLIGALLFHSSFDTWLYVVMIGVHSVASAHSYISPVALVFLNNLLMLMGVYALFAVGVGLALSLAAIQQRDRSLAEARMMAQEAQLAALRLQINPHFLFNALNAVTALIGVGRMADAQAVVSRLSAFFRSTLYEKADELVTLEQELEVIEAYLEIEATRFGARLEVIFDAPPDLRGSLVPHFVLQPLVENAIKHAVAPSPGPVTVGVEARRGNSGLLLSVRDNGSTPTTQSGPGVGLRNLDARLRAIFGSEYRLEVGRRGDSFVAEIECPLRCRTTSAAA